MSENIVTGSEVVAESDQGGSTPGGSPVSDHQQGRRFAEAGRLLQLGLDTPAGGHETVWMVEEHTVHFLLLLGDFCSDPAFRELTHPDAMPGGWKVVLHDASS